MKPLPLSIDMLAVRPDRVTHSCDQNGANVGNSTLKLSKTHEDVLMQEGRAPCDSPAPGPSCESDVDYTVIAERQAGFNKTSVRKAGSFLTGKSSASLHDGWYHSALDRGLRKKNINQGIIQRVCCTYCRNDVPHTPLARFVDSGGFSAICAVMILSNTFFIAIDTDMQMKAVLEDPHREDATAIFKVTGRGFTLYFSLELIFRIVAHRLWFFVGPEWKWNIFGILLVVSSIFQDIFEGANISFMRVLHVFRMIRVMRLIRVLRFFRELRKMLLSILACIASLMWALGLLFLIMFLFSMLFLQAATAFLEDKTNFDAHHAEFEEWYSGLFRTMFSLLLAITGGTDWLAIVDPLKAIHWTYQVIFSFYILFVIFGVVNVLTGVFLENAAEFMDRDLMVQGQLVRMENFVSEMMHLFREFDPDNTGRVDNEELYQYLKLEKVQAYLAAHNLDCTHAAALVGLIDSNNTEGVDLREFILGMLRLRGGAKSVDLQLIDFKIDALKALVSDVLERCVCDDRHRSCP